MRIEVFFVYALPLTTEVREFKFILYPFTQKLALSVLYELGGFHRKGLFLTTELREFKNIPVSHHSRACS
ncbi:MAG: hypothetical protein WD578_10335, partial [Bacteroidales bacterium]